MPDTKTRLLLGLIIISLALNIYSVATSRSLRNELEGAKGAFSSGLQNIASQVSSLSWELGELARKAENLLEYGFQTDLEKSSAGSVYLNLDFTLREVGPEDAIQAFYRADSDPEWTAAPVTALGGNSYRAELLLKGRKITSTRFRPVPGSRNRKKSPGITTFPPQYGWKL